MAGWGPTVGLAGVGWGGVRVRVGEGGLGGPQVRDRGRPISADLSADVFNGVSTNLYPPTYPAGEYGGGVGG